MKKFIIAAAVLVLLFFVWDYAYYHLGLYVNADLPWSEDEEIGVFVKTDGKEIYLDRNKDGEFAPFTVRGVDMGTGIPGEWSTSFAIDGETYTRWFGEMQKMGANTLRIYTIQSSAFYDAFYKYNTEREEKGEEPL